MRQHDTSSRDPIRAGRVASGPGGQRAAPRRRARAGLVAAAVVLLAGCSGGATSGSPGTTATTGPEATGASTTGEAYVVQSVGAATLGPVGADGSATLVLEDAPTRSVYFTSGPNPRTGGAPTGYLVEVLNRAGSSHAAALTWTAQSGTGTLVVDIQRGAFDAGAGTLTYTVRPIPPEATSSDAVATQARDRRSIGDPTTLPDDVTSATLFIDPVGTDQLEAYCNLTVKNDLPVAVSVDSITSEDPGGMTDWDEPLSDGQQIQPGESATASSGASNWDCRAGVSFGFMIDDSVAEVELALLNPVFSESTWSCSTKGGGSCTVEANEQWQPMNMTVTISQ